MQISKYEYKTLKLTFKSDFAADIRCVAQGRNSKNAEKIEIFAGRGDRECNWWAGFFRGIFLDGLGIRGIVIYLFMLSLVNWCH